MHGDANAEAVRQLEDCAALGCLLNAIAHDVNNQLTNLMLGADQARSGDAEALDLVLDQAQRLTALARAVQGLGQSNLEQARERVALDEVAVDVASWHARGGRGSLEIRVVDRPRVVGVRTHVVLAAVFLARWLADRDLGPLALEVLERDVPRSAWSGSTETVRMACLRLVAGAGGGVADPLVKPVLDDFFGAARSGDEVALMGCWEIVRKLRGRLDCRVDGTSAEASMLLPLAAD